MATKLDYALVRDYLVKLLQEGEEFLKEFYQELKGKSSLFQETFKREKIDELQEEDLLKVFSTVFSVRRNAQRILRETPLDTLREALKELLYSREGFDQKVWEFAKRLRGAEVRRLRDLGAEILHFTFPKKYVLWNSWVWDPQTETGAVVFLKEEPPVGGKGRQMFGTTYEEFEEIYKQIYELLKEFGLKVEDYFFVDIFLAVIYGTYVDYMTLSTMHSAKGFFPPASVMAKRLLGVNAPIIYKEV